MPPQLYACRLVMGEYVFEPVFVKLQVRLAHEFDGVGFSQVNKLLVLVTESRQRLQVLAVVPIHGI